MFYTEITFHLTPYSEEAAEIITASLGEAGFDSFSYTDDGLKGYIPSAQFQPEVLTALHALPLFSDRGSLRWEVEEIENQDWNKRWEESFSPIRVGNRIVVRAGFHAPEEGIEYDIVIDPKMSFGTGHHATTALMLETILDLQPHFKGITVLDMGCGTAILSIMAIKAGAKQVTGIDIDEWAYHNAFENLATNRIDGVDILIGDAGLLEASPLHYDVILANINRNILLEDMPRYTSVLKEGGLLIMSGFYLSDLPMIQERAAGLGLTLHSHKTREEWTVAIFNK